MRPWINILILMLRHLGPIVPPNSGTAGAATETCIGIVGSSPTTWGLAHRARGLLDVEGRINVTSATLYERSLVVSTAWATPGGAGIRRRRTSVAGLRDVEAGNWARAWDRDAAVAPDGSHLLTPPRAPRCDNGHASCDGQVFREAYISPRDIICDNLFQNFARIRYVSSIYLLYQ